MHSHQPPIEIDGFHHPHALTGIPMRRRPDWAEAMCGECGGRGARNEILHLDTMRCRQAGCATCDGAGWTANRRPTTDIIAISGVPTWVERLPPPTLVVVRQACKGGSDTDRLKREAA